MRIQIDTTEKTISVEGEVVFKELIGTLEKLLPKQWKEFKLKSNTVINSWTSPIIIDHWRPAYPWQQLPYVINDVVLCGTNSANGTTASCLTNGVFNVEVTNAD